MRELKKIKTDLVKVKLPTGQEQSGYMEFTCYKVENDTDAIDLVDVMASDVQILNQIQCEAVTYVFIRAFIPSKIAIGDALQPPKV